MCAVGLLQVFNRFVLNRSLSWSEEFQIYCHVWIVFLAHPDRLPARGAPLGRFAARAVSAEAPGRPLTMLIEILWIWFAGVAGLARVAGLRGGEAAELARPRAADELGRTTRMVVGGPTCCFVVLRPLVLTAREAANDLGDARPAAGDHVDRHPDPAVHRAHRLHRHRRRAGRGDADVRAEKLRPARFVHAARAAVLHPRRRADDRRRHEPATGRFFARAGRAPEGRAGARVGRGQHGVRRRSPARRPPTRRRSPRSSSRP